MTFHEVENDRGHTISRFLKLTLDIEGNPYSTGNWLPNANEMDTKNMKCTWPTPDQVGVGGNARYG